MPDDDDLMRSQVPPQGQYQPPEHFDSPGPPPFAWEQLPADQQAQLEARQTGRARVMALLLGAFVILVFAISIVKIREGMAH